MPEPIVVVPYDESWKEEFQRTGSLLRQALGERALRIDHIGSTSVAGLDAKPIVDIQISVAALEPMAYKPLLEAEGYLHQADNPDRTKRYFRESPGRKRTHLHVREAGSWSEQLSLLFRDYLREQESARVLYAAQKHALARKYKQPQERELYVEGKGPVVWQILQEAHQWSQRTGWRPGGSDA
ncbi:GrpB family protein [Paenibacillus sp. CC-CFT747]|nr:GrpB family protein [Paenibacillus sp. CC-CFT747]